MPATRTVPRFRCASAAAVFMVRSVVMMARAASFETVGRKPVDQARQSGDDFVAVQFDADHAGRRGEHLRHRQLEHPGGFAAVPERDRVPVARGAIGVAALIRMAPTRPFDCASCRRHRRTGAACTRLRVNTAAALRRDR